jgi:hypothetical protein
MSIRKSIHLLAVLLSLSAASVVAADVGGAFVANATACPPALGHLSNVRTAVADAEALVHKGDLAAARTRIKALDASCDGAVDGSAPQAAAHWRVVDRAIDRGLDRALLALRPHQPNVAMSEKALADLLAAVDQVSGRGQARAGEGRP